MDGIQLAPDVHAELLNSFMVRNQGQFQKSLHLWGKNNSLKIIPSCISNETVSIYFQLSERVDFFLIRHSCDPFENILCDVSHTLN